MGRTAGRNEVRATERENRGMEREKARSESIVIVDEWDGEGIGRRSENDKLN